MSDEILFDGVKYISASEASSMSGFTRDYIGRLCRDNRLRGRRVGKNWYVDRGSLQSFLVTQEYSKTLRNQSLAQERVREYHDPEPLTARVVSATPAAPVASAAAAGAVAGTKDIRDRLSQAMTKHSEKTLASARSFASTPAGISHAALQAAHIPVYALTPMMEFAHKLIALTLTAVLVFGTYAAVDPQYANIALGEIHDQVATALDSYRGATGGGVDALAGRTQDSIALAAEHPQVAAAGAVSLFSGFPDVAAGIARAFNTGVNSLVYAVAFPSSLIGSQGIAANSSSGSVSISVQPYAQPFTVAATLASGSPSGTAGTVSSGGTRTVIERVVTTPAGAQLLAQSGGITEAELDAKLNQLDNKLSAQMYSIGGNASTVAAQNYAVTAQTNAIGRLVDVAIQDSTMTGGSISGTSIDAKDLSVGGDTSLNNTLVTGTLDIKATKGQSADVLHIDDENGTTIFAVSPDGTLTTNTASSTSLVSSILITGNATATALFVQSLIASVSASTTNLLSYNSTSSNGYISNFTADTASTTDLLAQNATSTTFFAALGHIATGIIDNFTATFANIGGLTVTNSTTTNATSTNLAVTGNTQLANTSVNGDLTLSGSLRFTSSSSTISANTASTTNFIATSGTSTNFFATNASTTNLFAQNASTTNATSTNLFAALGHLTTGIIDNLTVAFANLTGLTVVNSTTTNATSTNSFSTNLAATNAVFTTSTSTNLIATFAALGTTTLTNLSVTNTSTSTFAGGFSIGNSQFVVQQSTGNVGVGIASPTSLLSVGGTTTIQFSQTTNPVASTDAKGATYLGLGGQEYNPNSYRLIGFGYNSALTSNYYPAYEGYQETNSTGQTLGDLVFLTRNSTTGSVEPTERLRITSGGNIGVGTTTPGSILAVQGVGNFVAGATSTLYNGLSVPALSVSGFSALGNSTLGNATTTNLFSTTASSTNLFAQIANFGTLTVGGTSIQTGLATLTNASSSLFSVFTKAYFGGTATTTIDSAGNVVVGGSLTASGNSTFGNATSTNSFATTASSTNLFAQSAAVGSLTVNSVTGNSLLYVNGSQQVSGVSVNPSLTFSAGTLSLNLSNPNTFSALQQFAGGASSSQESVFTKAYFGGTGTSTFSSTGALTLANGTVLNATYASTTALNASGEGYFGTASTTNLTVSSAPSGILHTNASGAVSASAVGLNSSDVSGTLPATSGGTGQSSFSIGDILYADSNGTLARLPIGATGNILQVQAGLPAWGANSGGSGGSGATGLFSTTTSNLIIYPTDTSKVITIGTNATSSLNSIFEVAGQSYFSSKVGIATTAPATTLSVGGNGYITGGLGVGVLNTNAGTLQTSGNANIGGTLTIGSLSGFLKGSSGVVSSQSSIGLASADVSGILPVGNGGTGWANIAANTLVTGNGAGALATTTIGSSLLLSAGTLSLNTANPNTFSALQQFSNASSSLLSVFTKAYFGGTATTTIDSAGNVVVGGSLTASGNSTFGNATSTNSFATTASSTNLFAQSAAVGSAALSSVTLPNISNSLLYTNGTQLAAASVGSSLSFSAGTLSLNLSNPNTFSALQQFAGGASSSQESVFTKAYFGGTATTTIDSAGNIVGAGTLVLNGTSGTSTIAGGQGFVVGSANNLTVQGATGNVGVGIASPTSLLSVGGTTTIQFSQTTNPVASTDAKGATYLGLGGQEYNPNSYRLIGFGYNSALTSNYYPAYEGYQETNSTGQTLGDLVFLTRNSTTGSVEPTERLRITAAGNVGIGTSTPTNKLEVAGNVFFGGNVTATGTLNVTGATTFGTLLSSTAASTSLLSVFQKAYFGGTATSTFDSAGNLSLVSNGLTVGANQLVASGGNVGIGTSTPWAKLTLYGANTTSGSQAFNVTNSASTTNFSIDNAGFISAGASQLGTPSGIFTIDASSSTTTISNLALGNLIFDTDAGNVTLSDIPVDSNAAAGVQQSQAINIGGNPIFTASGISNGTGGVTNLGVVIGTSTMPYALLHLVGSDTSANTSAFLIANSASTTLFTVNDNGNVGIATSSPSTNFGFSVSTTTYLAGNTTLTNATSTNFFSTTASSTNLFAQTASLGTLTAGTLTSTGLFSNTNASTSLLSVFTKAYFGGSATSTFDSAGNLVLGGTINKVTITAPATAGTLAFGTDNSTLTFQGTGTVVNRDSTDTFTNKTFNTGGTGNVFQIAGTGITALTGTGGTLVTSASPTFSGTVTIGSLSGAVSASGGVLSAGTLSIANGGTNATSQTTNGVNYFNGTSITSGTGLTFTGTNFGIGTTSPYAPLSVVGDTRLKESTNSATALTIENAAGSSTLAVSTIDTSANILSVASSTGTSYLDITSYGNVGVSTSTPFAKFGISLASGDTNTNAFLISSSTASATTTLFSIGNTGLITGLNFSLANGTTTSFFATTASSTNLFAQTATLGTLNLSGLATFANGFVSQASSTVVGNFTSTGIGSFATLAATQTSGTSTIASGQGFTIGGSQFVVQQGSGNVGIGTTTPGAALEVSGNIPLKVTGALSTYEAGIVFTRAGSAAAEIGSVGTAGQIVNTSAAGDFGYKVLGSGNLLFSTGGSSVERMRITSTGSVGIGTSTPWALLSIYGANTTSGSQAFNVTNSASTTNFSIDNAGFISAGASQLGTPSGIFTIDASSSTTTISNLSVGNLNFDTDAGVVALSNLPLSSNPAAGTIESQSILIGDTPVFTAYGENDGADNLAQNTRVAIGTSTPWAKLSVEGLGTGSEQLAEFFNSASTTQFRLLDNGTAFFNGKVGIGTTSPTNALEVAGNTFLGGNVVATGTLTTAGLTNTGLFSTTNASTSLFSVFTKAYFGGSATSTFDSAGNLALAGTLTFPTDNTFDIGASGATRPHNIYVGTSIIGGSTVSGFATYQAQGTGNFIWNARSQLQSPADGQIALLNNAGTGFSRLQFGGTTNSFSALASNGTALSIVPADASFAAASFGIGTTTPFGAFGISLNSGANYNGNFAFNIASSTNSATTTLFSIDNTGLVQIPKGGEIDIAGSSASPSAVRLVGGAYGDIMLNNNNVQIISDVSSNVSFTATSLVLVNHSPIRWGTTSSYPELAGNGAALSVIPADASLAAMSFGVGTTTPFGEFAIQANSGANYTNNNLFSIASSTNSATTTLFSIANTGAISGASGSFTVDSSGNLVAPTLNVTATTGFANNGGAILTNIGGTPEVLTNTSGVILRSTNYLGWSNAAPNISSSNDDTTLFRSAASVLEVGNSATANSNGGLLAGAFGIGTTSISNALLSITATSTTGLGSPTSLFTIASTTGGTATSTLFSVDNTGNVNIGSSGTVGFSLYNTSDQTTNYERMVLQTPTNNANGMFGFLTQKGGSGTGRSFEFQTANSGADMRLYGGSGNTDNSGFDLLSSVNSNNNWNGFRLTTSGTGWSTNSGINNFFALLGGVSQSGTAGYTSLLIQPTETSLGSGAKYLIQAGTSTAPNLFNVTNTGLLGLGTSTPFGKFAINLNSTDASYSGNNAFIISSSTPSATTTLFSIDNTGAGYFANKTGIGTTTNLGTGLTIGATASAPTTDTANYPLAIISNNGLSGSGLIGFFSGGNHNGNLQGGIGAASSGNGLQFFNRDQFAVFTEDRSGFSVFGSYTSAAAGGSQNVFSITPNAWTEYGTEQKDFLLNSHTLTVGGTTANQRFVQFGQPTITATTSFAVSGIAANTYIAGAPVLGGSATTPTTAGLYIDTGSSIGTGATNAYGLYVNVPTGATNNYAAYFGGNVGVGTTSPTGLLALQANSGSTYAGNLLFNIASSTNSATTTLFSVDNQGNATIAKTLAINGFGLGAQTFGVSGSAWITGGVRVNGGNAFVWDGRSQLLSPADGQVLLQNSASTGFSRLQFGGTTNSFAALASAGTALSVTPADGSLAAASFGIGTTTPFGEFAIQANSGANYTNNNLFDIASSTGSATTTLFSVSNTGATTVGGNLTVNGATSTFSNGINLTTGCFSVGGTCITGGGGSSASSTLLTDSNTFTKLQSFSNATSTLFTATTAWAGTLLGTTFDTGASGNVFKIAGTQFTAVTGTGSTLVASVSPTFTGTLTAAAANFSGNVGVGTTTPWGALAISSVAQQSGSIPLFNIASTTNTSLFTVFGNGTVGIGTTTPTATFSVQGGSGQVIDFAGSTGASYLHITSAGNVGIGTTTPGSIFGINNILNITAATSTFYTTGGINLTAGCFSINGTCVGGSNITGTTGQFAFFSAANIQTATSSIFLASSGNVGIGTTSPQARLEVSNSSAASTTPFYLSNFGSATSSTEVGLAFRTDDITHTTGTTTASIFSIFQGGAGGIPQLANGDLAFSTLRSGLLSEAGRFTSAGNLGVGTTTPFRTLSVTSASSNSQLALSYDGTRDAELRVDSTGSLNIEPSGQNVYLNNDNFWTCTGGSISVPGCPSGTPTGLGNIIAENKLGVGTTTLNAKIVVETQDSTTNFFQLASTTQQNIFTVNSNGNVLVGTTSASKQLNIGGLLAVGANSTAPVTMGTATSTFNGDVKISGKLDVGTIDPVYTIDGTKYATYGESGTGEHEETSQTIELTQKDPVSGKYVYTINFDTLDKGSDTWLFYEITDFGPGWRNLTVLLTPSFDGTAFYQKVPDKNELLIEADQPGEVSMRLTGDRFDFAKWGNVRPDQNDRTEPGFILTSKPSAQTAAVGATQ